jgi:mono/diheme cytochrome c family protein
MKPITVLLYASFITLGACSQQQANEQQPGSEAAAAAPAKQKYYKVTHVEVGPTIDQAKVKAGTDIFDVKCTACHKLDERYVGPALGKVTQRRTPEYIMNMILDTETMINNDDTVQCLLQTYLLKMPDQHVDENDARNVLEFLRKAGDERK